MFPTCLLKHWGSCYHCIQRLAEAKGKIYWPHSFCLGIWYIGWNFIRCFLSLMDVPTAVGGHFCDDEKSLSHREGYNENILAPKIELLVVNNICLVPLFHRPVKEQSLKSISTCIGQSHAPMTTKMQVMQRMICGKYVYPQNSTKQMYLLQHWANTVCAFLRKTVVPTRIGSCFLSPLSRLLLGRPSLQPCRLSVAKCIVFIRATEIAWSKVDAVIIRYIYSSWGQRTARGKLSL